MTPPVTLLLGWRVEPKSNWQFGSHRLSSVTARSRRSKIDRRGGPSDCVSGGGRTRGPGAANRADVQAGCSVQAGQSKDRPQRAMLVIGSQVPTLPWLGPSSLAANARSKPDLSGRPPAASVDGRNYQGDCPTSPGASRGSPHQPPSTSMIAAGYLVCDTSPQAKSVILPSRRLVVCSTTAPGPA